MAWTVEPGPDGTGWDLVGVMDPGGPKYEDVKQNPSRKSFFATVFLPQNFFSNPNIFSDQEIR